MTEKLEELPESERRVLAIVCTDRGQHDQPVRITTAYRFFRGQRGMSHVLRWYRPPALLRDIAEGLAECTDSLSSYEFQCPRCPRRNVQVRQERWWRIVEDHWRAGLPSLDISRL